MSTDLLLTKDEINDIFKKAFRDNIDNKDLTNNLGIEFARKGLNPSDIPKLFLKEKEWKDLDVITQIAVAKVCHLTLGIKEVYPKNIFSENFLKCYDDTTNEKNKVNIVELKNMLKIDDFNYIGKITFKQIYNYMTSEKFNYNFNTQRASTYTQIGTSENVIRTITLSEKNVENIKEDILNKIYEPDTVVINNRIIRGKESKFKEEQIIENLPLYNLKIDVDMKDTPQQTILDVLDGFHRLTAVVRAVRDYKAKTGQWLDGYLYITLVFRTEAEASRLTSQTFKRSDTTKDWKAMLNNDEYMKFTSDLCDKIKLLNGNVADTQNQMLAENKLTYKSLLADMVKKCRIDVKSKSNYRINLNDISDIINTMLDNLMEEFTDIDDMKKNSLLLECNVIAGYIYCANKLLDSSEKEINDFCEELFLRQEELKEITDKKLGASTIADKFKNIFSEISE